MWTGFRWALGGAQEFFGVTADLACYSKAIANGMPIAVLAGRADVMSLLDQHVFFFTTFGGEALSLAATGPPFANCTTRTCPPTWPARVKTDGGLQRHRHRAGHP